MAKFRASKGYHFSKDGLESTTWAKFEKVPKSDPIVYEFETKKPADVAALRKLIKDEVPGYADITEVKKPARTAAGGDGAEDGDADSDDGDATDTADGGDQNGD